MNTRLWFLGLILSTLFSRAQLVDLFISDFEQINPLTDLSLGNGSWAGNVSNSDGFQIVGGPANTGGGGMATFEPIDMTRLPPGTGKSFGFRAAPLSVANEFRVSLFDADGTELSWKINLALYPQYVFQTFNLFPEAWQQSAIGPTVISEQQNNLGPFDFLHVTAFSITGTGPELNGPFNAAFDGFYLRNVLPDNTVPESQWFAVISSLGLAAFVLGRKTMRAGNRLPS